VVEAGGKTGEPPVVGELLLLLHPAIATPASNAAVAVRQGTMYVWRLLRADFAGTTITVPVSLCRAPAFLSGV